VLGESPKALALVEAPSGVVVADAEDHALGHPRAQPVEEPATDTAPLMARDHRHRELGQIERIVIGEFEKSMRRAVELGLEMIEER